MLILMVGLLVFFGTHVFSAVRSRGPGRDIREKIGFGRYMGLYSLISLIGLVLIIYGYGAARGLGSLYEPPSWGAHLNLALMVPAMILLVASQLPAGYIKRAAKHPMLLAVKIWAVGHLLANGEVNSVILFGSFLAYGVFDRIMVKRRGDMGAGAAASVSATMDASAVVLGLGLWAALVMWLHPILFGVAVLG